MMPSNIIADRIRVLLNTPLLAEFTRLGRYEAEDWACALVSRIAALVDERPPHVWEITVDEVDAPALSAVDRRGTPISVAQLLCDPRDRAQGLPAIVLMLKSGEGRELLPGPKERIRCGDRVLLCGRLEARYAMMWTTQRDLVLDYVLTGNVAPGGAVWRWWLRRRQRARA
jgi:hypothetical protein